MCCMHSITATLSLGCMLVYACLICRRDKQLTTASYNYNVAIQKSLILALPEVLGGPHVTVYSDPTHSLTFIHYTSVRMISGLVPTKCQRDSLLYCTHILLYCRQCLLPPPLLLTKEELFLRFSL